jgi:hypothetical protein
MKRITITAIVILLLCNVGLGLLVSKYYRQAENNAIGRDEAIRIANGARQETEVYRNKYGDQVTKTKAAELDVTNLKALAKTKELEYLKKFNVKPRRIESTGTISTILKTDSIKYDTVYVPCDSTFTKAFHYVLHDEWNDIDALVLDTPRLEIRDKIYWVQEWQRKHKFVFKNWRFGKKEWFQEVTNENNLIRIDGQSVFVIRRHK